ncbi:MAG: hypothetical protein ACI9R3_003156 [Verrucomicrobiales bacterium]|jgi:hypothetical protein
MMISIAFAVVLCSCQSRGRARQSSPAMQTKRFDARVLEGIAMPLITSDLPPSDDPFAIPGSADQRSSVVSGSSHPRAVLEVSGIQFPAGAFAFYRQSTGQLTVRNTPENLKMIGIFLSN